MRREIKNPELIAIMTDRRNKNSGSESRKKMFRGVFHQKPHPERPNEELSTYVQYSNVELANKDVPVEEEGDEENTE